MIEKQDPSPCQPKQNDFNHPWEITIKYQPLDCQNFSGGGGVTLLSREQRVKICTVPVPKERTNAQV